MEQCDVNYTSDELTQYQYSTVSWSVILVFVPLVEAFGVSSNFAFIFVVYCIKSMRTITREVKNNLLGG